MEIIQWHNTKSKPVKNYEEIRAIAEEMLVFIQNGKFKGYYDKAYAIHHSQVSTDPYNFFVVHPDYVYQKLKEKRFFPNCVIVNPLILGGATPKRVAEACMSHPFRKIAGIERYSILDVYYQVPVKRLGIGPYYLKDVRQKMEEMPAQIFQHEFLHSEGKPYNEKYQWNIHSFGV